VDQESDNDQTEEVAEAILDQEIQDQVKCMTQYVQNVATIVKSLSSQDQEKLFFVVTVLKNKTLKVGTETQMTVDLAIRMTADLAIQTDLTEMILDQEVIDHQSTTKNNSKLLIQN
jgi:hypothetical protein